MAEPASSTAIVSVRSLTRAVAGKVLVDAVSFDLRRGEVVAVLGPSGSGKTSLLRLIAGFDAPTGGSIELFGDEVSTAGRVCVAPEARSLALAFQDATLFPHLDALGNVAFAIRDGRRQARESQARDELAAMGLADVDRRDVATLSGGEAQRVSLARALAARGRLLLLDEPFGNVDRLTRADLIGRLKARLATTAGAILITHDAADAVDLGARVLLMRAGRLVAEGSPAALLAGSAGDWARDYLRPALPGLSRAHRRFAPARRRRSTTTPSRNSSRPSPASERSGGRWPRSASRDRPIAAGSKSSMSRSARHACSSGLGPQLCASARACRR